jgi:hypothetical protein
VVLAELVVMVKAMVTLLKLVTVPTTTDAALALEAQSTSAVAARMDNTVFIVFMVCLPVVNVVIGWVSPFSILSSVSG